MQVSASPPADPQPVTPPPTVLVSRYRLERRLAQGGMAEVWLATDLSLDRHVAVKLLKPSLASDPVIAERFRREAVAVAGLTHPNIVAVHDAFEHEGRQAVVMQLVNGKSLRQLLDDQKRLSPELTIHIGACIAAALDSAHAAGLVHRDVKPGNILVTPDGRVLLTDFGIAKGLDSAGDDLTSDNVMMGTAKYLSPEQVRGKRLDGRADLYSLGLVLYECLAGRVPFLGHSDADTALARLQRDPTDLNRLRPTLPVGLVELIHRLLARNPAHRPPTGSALRTELQRIAREPRETIDHTPLPSPVHPTVPGEPTPTRANTPPAVRPGRPRRDPTPATGAPIRASPARGLQQRWTPSLVVVGGLLAIAAIVALVLVATINAGTGERLDVPTTTVAPGPTTAVAAATPTIATITAFDPDGDQQENDSHTSQAAADGDPSTAWSTVCYSSRFMGGKRGVGLVVSLGTASTGTVRVDVLNAPYQIELYATGAGAAPTSFESWGAAVGPKQFDTTPRTVQFEVATPAQFMLVWLRELGQDPECSADNPFRGRLGEVTFTP